MGELTYHTDMSREQLNAVLGIKDNRNIQGDRLAELKINNRRRDEAGNDLIGFQGHFYLKNRDQEVFAEKVTIRVLSQHFQWTDFDEDSGKPRNKTIMIPFLYMEPKDEKGTLRCGKPTSRDMEGWSKERKSKYKSISLSRQLRCLVNYTGKTATGEEVVVENVPAIIFNKKTSYLSFEDDVVKKMGSNKDLTDYNIECSANEHVNGSVVYYTWSYKPDLSVQIPLQPEVHKTMMHFAKMVMEDNKKIEESYTRSLKERSIEDAALDAMENGLENDLQDA